MTITNRDFLLDKITSMSDLDIAMMLSSYLDKPICKYCNNNGKCFVIDKEQNSCEKGIKDFMNSKKQNQ